MYREMHTNEVDDEAAIGVTVEEGLSIRQECGSRKMICVGGMKKVSSVGDWIAKADDRFITLKWSWA